MAGLAGGRVFQRGLKINVARVCSPTQSGRTKSSDEMPPKPKGPKRGFLAFYSEIRADLQKENPGIKITESGRMAGQKWGLLSEEEKNRYKPTEESLKKYNAALSKWKESLTEEQLSLIKEHKDRRKRLRLKKHLQALGKPAKPAMNAFAYYVKSQPIERGDAPASMYIQGLSQQWNKLPVEDKEPFEAEAIKRKTEYYSELDVWEQKMIKAGKYDVIRKSSLPASIDRKTLKPKTKKAVPKRAAKKLKTAGKKKAKKSAKKSKASEEDVSWMKEE